MTQYEEILVYPELGTIQGFKHPLGVVVACVLLLGTTMPTMLL